MVSVTTFPAAASTSVSCLSCGRERPGAVGCPALPPGPRQLRAAPRSAPPVAPSPYLHADDVLAVDLADAVVGQEAVAGGRAALGQRHDLPLLDHDADVAGAVLVHGDSALERSAGRARSAPVPPASPTRPHARPLTCPAPP